MIFKHTEEQEMLRRMVRDFAENECWPGAAERDEKEEFDRSLFDQMAEQGLTGIVFPEEYGGAEADYISYAIAIEEISRVDGSAGVTLSAHTSLGANPIYKFGTQEQKMKYLKPLAEGKKIGALGLTESAAGSDAGGTKTTAVLDGEKWVINGSKIFITNGGEAETYVITAVTDKEVRPRHKGISAFIVEKGTPGFTFGKKEHKLGIRSSTTVELVFDECRIPKENLLGSLDDGFRIAMVTLDYGRLGIAAQALGIAQGAYDFALGYAKERKQFSQPIANFQAIQFKMADMATEIDAARLLLYRACYLADQGAKVSKEAAMAKMYCSDVAMKVTVEAVQILGGYGYTREYPVERMMRDAKITQIYEGTNEIQRLVISANLLKD